MRKLVTCLALLGFLGSAFTAPAQDDLPPAKSGVRITFLPPPMEGTLSLGIYDKKGRLVRVLAREATEKDFTVGLNGFITHWDGKDDSGKPAPAGNYNIRGYSVGAVQVDGEAYHGNDWMIDDTSPRLRRITELHDMIVNHGELHLDAETSNGASIHLTCDAESGRILAIKQKEAGRVKPVIDYGAPKPGDDPRETEQQSGGKDSTGNGPSRAWGFGIRDGKIFRRTDAGWEKLELPSVEKVIAFAHGDRVGTDLWVIDETAQGTEVKEFGIPSTSLEAEFKRRLVIEAGEPTPKKISYGAGGTLVLLEEKAGIQRLRSLRLEEAATPSPATSDSISQWKITLSRTILSSDSFDAIKPLLVRPDGKPFAPEKEFIVRLINNPLLKDEPTTAHVNIGYNDRGSFLQTTDGLPLRRITETPHLRWAVIGREGSGKLLTILQSDGAVVEEFKARRLANMMAFDAGDYEWAGK